MEMIGNFSPPTQPSWFDKVPSPTGSEDSGLGWSSPDPLSVNACFNYIETESACSPHSPNEASSSEFSPFNQEQKPASDVSDLLEILDQKPDETAVTKQPSKKTIGKSSSKKRASTESSQNSKLERCFQPKTGNGKPRQTSVKRKPSQKTPTAYPYPGVRVETVREKLRKMREGRGPAVSQSVSSTIQSLNNIANGYSNQGYTLATPGPDHGSPQYQQPYSSFQQHAHDIFVPSPSQSANYPQTSMMSSVPQNSPNYVGPATSPSLPYELSTGSDVYAQSLPSCSPARSSTCSPFQQKLSPSPQISPVIQTAPIPSPAVAQYNEMSYGVINAANSDCRGYGSEQSFSYSSSSYGMKQNSLAIDDYSTCDLFFQQFNSSNNHLVASGVRDLVQSIRRGDVQQLRGIFTRNRDVVDAQDPEGKALIFHAIESSQFEVVKLLLDFQANLSLLTAEGNTILHTAATCSKSDILVLLLNALQAKEMQMLLRKTTIKKDSTPLHLAAEANLFNNFIQLLRFGANYTAQDRNGYSPLHIVVRNANVMAVRAMLQVAKRESQLSNGTKLQDLINLRTSNHNTALHYAAGLHRSGEEGQRNQFEIAQLLLADGADPLALNVNGKSPKSLLPHASSLLQMFDIYIMQNSARCGYPASEMRQFQMSCAPSNQYNGVVFPHCQ